MSRPDHSLERKHAEVVLLELAFVNVARRIDRDARERVHLRLTGVVGNLEVIDRGSRDETEPGRRVEEVGEVAEGRTLVAGIVDRGRPGSRWLDAAIGVQVLGRDEVAELVLRAAVLEARLLGVSLSAVEVHVAAIVEQAVLGLDVDDSSGAQAELGRQRPGEQADALGEARAQRLPESRDSFGKLDAIDSVLKIGMVAANVELPV